MMHKLEYTWKTQTLNVGDKYSNVQQLFSEISSFHYDGHFMFALVERVVSLKLIHREKEASFSIFPFPERDDSRIIP